VRKAREGVGGGGVGGVWGGCGGRGAIFFERKCCLLAPRQHTQKKTGGGAYYFLWTLKLKTSQYRRFLVSGLYPVCCMLYDRAAGRRRVGGWRLVGCRLSGPRAGAPGGAEAGGGVAKKNAPGHRLLWPSGNFTSQSTSFKYIRIGTAGGGHWVDHAPNTGR
jgi:hypothetical protein